MTRRERLLERRRSFHAVRQAFDRLKVIREIMSAARTPTPAALFAQWQQAHDAYHAALMDYTRIVRDWTT